MTLTERRRQARLGPRHQRVANLVLQGKKQSEIARELELSPRTVETYVAEIAEGLELLGVEGNVPPMRRILLSYRSVLGEPAEA